MDLTSIDLNKCPYDGTDVEAQMVSGGSILLVCPHCGGEWESHGAWTREVHAPVGGAGHRETAPGDDITVEN